MNPLTVTRPPNKIEDRQGAQAGGLRRFRPRLALGFQQELHALADQVSGLPYEAAQLEIERTLETADARRQELASLGLSADELTPTLQWTTALRVLRDLHTQGWRLSSDDEGLLLDSPGVGPSGQDPEVQKLAIRRSFSFARDAQLAEPSIARFIKGMERKGIDRVFADGAEVAARTAEGGVDAIQPELELVETGARDAGTGLLLQDIWRYARHFWSIPYQSTPGRNMFYLIRDGALPERPLIGIAALGNPVLGLAQRDDYAGWSLRGLQSQMAKMDARKQRAVQKKLVQVLDEGIEEIYASDLFRGRRPKDWRVVVARLREIEQESADQRLEELGRKPDGRDEEYVTIRAAHTATSKGQGESVDWTAIAKTNLYRRKRAGALADLIRAKGTLAEAGAPSSGWLQRALMTEDGVRAVEVALRRIKQTVIASSVMELITCGAVPPYRDVLGGKLVAVMMLSRTVVDDYQAKYADHVSLIASALAAQPVKRPTRLALITTSSLYAVGSSQYNRLKVPADEGSVAYRRIGMTESFGTVHFAQDTVLALSDLARITDSNRRRVNNLFGEGTSPKLRLVRSGIESLGLQPDVFLRHHSPRLLYGAELCSNASDVFLGLSDRPKYVLPDGAAGTELITEYWRERWLRNRLDREDVRERLEAERRKDFLLGNEPVLMGAGTEDGRGTTIEATADTPASAPEQGTKETFVERLYRSSNSYADRLNQEELEAIHVDLGVDGFLLEEANNGKQIIVTGNPGDGKTHLIERLRPQLEKAGAEVITDANACSDEETLKAWERCKKKKKPFVLAINEWPLFVLHRLAKEQGFTPVGEALRQVQAARFFVDSQQPEAPQENVVTIDLSLRNLLAPNVVQQVIDRLTQEQFYEGLNEADPMLKNREALRTPEVAERLTQLLKVVSVRLGHVTMRQLVGFIAYLLSAGQSAADRLTAGQDATGLSYSSLAFEGGEGQLFDTVRDVFDPAAMTHPIWDERLWRGDLKSSDWLEGEPPPSVLALPEVERKAGFRATKRRFYFEHAEGSSLLGLTPRDEVEFEKTLEEGAAGTTSMVRDLVLALNRFYEPDFPERDQDRLLLWQAHRFDVRAPAAFVSLRELPHQRLRVEALRYADWVESWLPPEQQDRRSFALVATGDDGKDCTLLEIDRELYLTLLEAQRGLGRSSWSRTATRKITRFVDRIDRALETKTGVEDLRIRNVDTDLDEKFAVQRKPARYQV